MLVLSHHAYIQSNKLLARLLSSSTLFLSSASRGYTCMVSVTSSDGLVSARLGRARRLLPRKQIYAERHHCQFLWLFDLSGYSDASLFQCRSMYHICSVRIFNSRKD